jgi:hypothetical protein
MTSTRKHIFKAIIERAEEGKDAAYVAIPFDVEKIFGTRGMVKVKATFDGHAYRGVLANMGTGCHVIGIRKDIRTAIGKSIGDPVQVSILADMEERTVEVPMELQKLLMKNAKAKARYESLSFTNRKEYAQWISSAKRDATKEKRLSQIIEMLLSGKKNPSEK